jgi:ABC-type sugar transport system substrate-binding protein
MFRSRAGWVVASALALGVAGLGAGCGDSDSDAGTAATPAAAETTAAGASASGIASAKKLVEQYSGDQPFQIAPLPEKPPAGKVVAEVNCNVPNCNPGGLKAPVQALGWKYEDFTFDIAKGPQDFVRQFDRAIAAKPDYISATMTFGDQLAKPALAKAKAAGIPVIGVVGSDLNSGFAGIIQGPTKQAFKMGQATAALALADAGGKTSIAVGTDPALPLLKPTLAGMEDAVKKDGAGSDVKSFSLSIARPPEANAAATVSFLQRNPDVKVLLYTASQLATGALERLKAAGVLDRVKVFLPYLAPTDLPSIKSGEVASGVAGEQNYSWRTADFFARLATGETPADKEPVGEFRIIGKENATRDQVDPPDYQNVYKQAWKVG